MPIYEFSCRACDTQFEEFRSIRDDSVVRCSSCGSADVRRLISATSFQLKGTGWYATDYKRSGGSTGSKDGNAKEVSGEGAARNA